MQQSGIAATPAGPVLGSAQNEYGVPIAALMMNGWQPYREPAAGGRAQNNGSITPTSGVESMIAVPMYAGDVITSISAFSTSVLTMGTNADGHLWFALRNPNGTLIAQSADQGGAATWASGTWKTLALTGGPYTIAQSGLYLCTIMQNIGTGGTPVIANVRGNSNSGAFTGVGNAGQPAAMRSFAFTAGTSLGAVAPSSPTLAQSGSWLYCVAS